MLLRHNLECLFVVPVYVADITSMSSCERSIVLLGLWGPIEGKRVQRRVNSQRYSLVAAVVIRLQYAEPVARLMKVDHDEATR